MSSNIAAPKMGQFLIWTWLKYVRKTPVKHNELDFRSSDWKLIFIGCTFFLVMIGLTLLFI